MTEPKMGFEGIPQRQTGLGDFLWEAHAAGTKALDFTAGRTFDDYTHHEVLPAAVESMLQILAASLADLQEYFPDDAAKIERAPAALALRARLGTAANAQVWSFVQQTLPMLVAELQVSLEEWHAA
jgi:uncharacterized protein with HEPN domain